MIRFAKFMFIAMFAFIVCACATAPGQKFTGLATPVQDKGDIYIYRTSAIFAVGQSFEVTLDGKQVGNLYNASYLHLRLPEGSYVLKVSPGGIAKTSDIQVQSKPGTQIFFEYDFATGPLANGFFIGSSIQPRAQEKALQDLKELKSST